MTDDDLSRPAPHGSTGSGPAGPRAAIVGAGLSGSLLALFLARRGYRVEVYEHRDDPRLSKDEGDGRSINLGLSARGIRALRRAGLLEELWPHTVPMRGRMIHAPSGEPTFQPYGTADHEILYSIRRGVLNALLIEHAEACDGVAFNYGLRCVDLDADTGTLTLSDTISGETRKVEADLVVGADGAFSAVRRFMQRGRSADLHQEFLEWGYKELTIPPAPDGGPRTPIEALHLWPAHRALIVAHPNTDNSLTCTLFLPHEGGSSFASIRSGAEAERFFRSRFPDALELIPDLAGEFEANPVGRLVSVRTSAWHAGERVVLVGDACHAVYPFYGQGMNASFEDCLVLDECLARHPADRGAALREYQDRRRPHTDVLAELSKENFLELRDGLRSPARLLRARADLTLNRIFPRGWQPLYTMISHTSMPYGEALHRARRQNALLGAAAAVLSAGTALGAAAAVRHLRRRAGSPARRTG
ncbi:NAD(P)/FAD-dependent oxidoreductase [Planomonospora sp. ID82291]|uniref:FAD-dependent oxidoreductase n=1 Tax=Planomonospora sp. ID82291 TaxID=2738136 RepID=UPI0018C3ED04|nr:NAD(P)/FAD-dependent oxidoreductase [Planomonospora sp. ID82291]MBG0815518.1 FAD-dependent monooxygenase [Planomonospora sp. ID82291]